MKTPNLLEVPKTQPSRGDRIKAFKSANKIWTHRSDAFEQDGIPWCAMLLPGNPHVTLPYANDMSPDDPIDIIAKYGIALEDCDVLVFDSSERNAIRRLCDKHGITCNL